MAPHWINIFVLRRNRCICRNVTLIRFIYSFSRKFLWGGEGYVIFIPEDNIQEIGILGAQTIRVQDWPCWIMSSF